MTLPPESEKTYLIQQKQEGTYVIDQTRGHRFFRTRSGGWFLLSGPGSPFDEDATIADPGLINYLSGLVVTANEAPDGKKLIK